MLKVKQKNIHTTDSIKTVFIFVYFNDYNLQMLKNWNVLSQNCTVTS